MSLIQFRGGQSHFAAAIFAGIVGRLLIIDFVVDDVAQASANPRAPPAGGR